TTTFTASNHCSRWLVPANGMANIFLTIKGQMEHHFTAQWISSFLLLSAKNRILNLRTARTASTESVRAVVKKNISPIRGVRNLLSWCLARQLGSIPNMESLQQRLTASQMKRL